MSDSMCRLIPGVRIGMLAIIPSTTQKARARIHEMKVRSLDFAGRKCRNEVKELVQVVPKGYSQSSITCSKTWVISVLVEKEREIHH